MPRTIRFVRSAETRLSDILKWTADRFGPAQARDYGTELLNRLKRVAAREIPDRSLQTIAGPLVDPRFRCVRAGEHFAVFLSSPDEIIVIDFLHSRADLPRRSNALPDPDKV